MAEIDWLQIIKNPIVIVVFACVLVTMGVLFLQVIKVKNKFIDYFWAALIISGVALILRYGVMALIPSVPDMPTLDWFINFIRYYVSALGIAGISFPIKKFVSNVQNKRASWNKSE